MIINNMISDKGNTIPNQYIIRLDKCDVFQSYEAVIAIRNYDYVNGKYEVYLNKEYYDYSRTTSKYRNKYLGLTNKEVKEKIKAKEFFLITDNKMESKFKEVIKCQA
tara:strand:+ start:265 stop:585 length:321 start_codon:yes stop_codon:yes gene_type:complete